MAENPDERKISELVEAARVELADKLQGVSTAEDAVSVLREMDYDMPVSLQFGKYRSTCVECEDGVSPVVIFFTWGNCLDCYEQKVTGKIVDPGPFYGGNRTPDWIEGSTLPSWDNGMRILEGD
tara:strand:- start:2291 stop:2662 length:372 start_codon:yes stop_codon:yes gene_type:complete